MGNTMYFPWEISFITALQSVMGPVLTWLASFITNFGEELILIIVMGFVYWCYDKKFGIYVGTNIVLCVILNPLLKNIALRRRPYMDHPGIQCLKPTDSTADIYDVAAQGYSFPSGHAMNSVTAYGSMARYLKYWKAARIGAFVLTFLVGLSRIALGVHYPTDILVGWVIGMMIIFLVPWMEMKIRRRWLFHLLLFLLCCTGIFYCHTNDYFSALGLMIGFFLAIPFEERFVRFKSVDFSKATGVLWCFLRVIGGGLIYYGLNTVLKMPFSKSFLESQTALAFLVRVIRYCIVTFIDLGVYPMIFKYVERKHE